MKLKNKTLDIYVGAAAYIPGWVHLAHRHLEKAPPANVKDGVFIVPIDLMKTAIPETNVDDIESITLMYKRG